MYCSFSRNHVALYPFPLDMYHFPREAEPESKPCEFLPFQDLHCTGYSFLHGTKYRWTWLSHLWWLDNEVAPPPDWLHCKHDKRRTWVLRFYLTLSPPPFVPGGSDGKESARNTGDSSSIPGPRRSPGGGKGCPLQYSWNSTIVYGLYERKLPSHLVNARLTDI